MIFFRALPVTARDRNLFQALISTFVYALKKVRLNVLSGWWSTPILSLKKKLVNKITMLTFWERSSKMTCFLRRLTFNSSLLFLLQWKCSKRGFRLLERDETGRVSGTDSGTTVTNRFVGHWEFSDVVTDHFRFNFDLVENWKNNSNKSDSNFKSKLFLKSRLLDKWTSYIWSLCSAIQPLIKRIIDTLRSS